MLVPQLRRQLQAAVSAGCKPSTLWAVSGIVERMVQLRLEDASVAVQGRRHASVKAQGAYRIPNKKTIPKKMGAKRTGDQFVIPGNIIYKQRGTIWHAGENTILGRDHTIHAAITGYVKYYRDPDRHPDRQYIGVAFEKADTLPYPKHGVRRRKLGFVPITRREPAELPTTSPSGIPTTVTRVPDPRPAAPNADPDAPMKAVTAFNEKRRIERGTRVLRLQDDYSYRETNYEIGRLVGAPGQVGGTTKLVSRKRRMRMRRAARRKQFAELKMVQAELKTRKEAEDKKRAADEQARLKAEAAAKRAAKAATAAQLAKDIASKGNAAKETDTPAV